MRTIILIALLANIGLAADRGEPWPRHTIDNSSRGADGVRLADVNGDGLPDITTGWEEGGVVRVYLNPGPAKAKDKWPAVSVGKAPNVEDAVFMDVDGDGATDVVSSCEGGAKAVFVHWAPKGKAKYLDPAAWTTELLPASKGVTRWMFAVPMQVDGKGGIDLVVGSKAPNATVGWFECPENPRDLAAWKWRPLYRAGWIMSIQAVDMDKDKDVDILISDRKGKTRGCLWLENGADWRERRIGASDREFMFLTVADLDADGLQDVLCSVKGRGITWFRRTAEKPLTWETREIPLPPDTGGGKGIAVADIDLDGTQDVVFTCEHSKGKSGAVWLSRQGAGWQAHEISGPVGTKYDRIEMLDLDGDGDLDLLTCEEAENLGVIWYENPVK